MKIPSFQLRQQLMWSEDQSCHISYPISQKCECYSNLVQELFHLASKKLGFVSVSAAICCAAYKTLQAAYHSPFCNSLRLQLGFARLLKTVSVWPVWSHHAVQAGPSRLEALLLCFIMAFDEPHELTHAIP